MIATARSCIEGYAGPCDDVHMALVGPPLWALVIGALVLVAAGVTVVALLLRRAARRAPWS